MKLLTLLTFILISIYLTSELPQKENSVYGTYKITVLSSPRGTISATLKIWKDEQGINRAQFTEDKEIMDVNKVEIAENEIYMLRFPDDNIGGLNALGEEEWELKIENNKISGRVNYDYQVTGYRLKID
ncbi:hypothetical protein GM418_13250 [Maribellus comscasis]|uniref:Uncharacterized protein n=1 Tax=Maribellus comscasis TaxID=2681766 RepID=A0A6I6JZJ0_9BACT|nr:hypothetical protein [Maribellus comscasis]QGY44593.1 hypothetical protein GM418_13250 [Maribellus comscasis]